MISNKEIITYLTSKETKAGFVDRLKIKYRPLICPFDDLLEYAKTKKRAFDIGCGSGQFASLLAKFTGVNQIEGVEIDDRLVRNANELANEFKNEKSISFSVFNGKTLPNSLGEAEIIYLIDVIHHVPKLQQKDFLKEIYSKMSSGSVLIFKDINASSIFVPVNKFHDFVFAGEIGNEISFRKAQDWAKEIGFEISQAFTKQVFLYPHYFLICKKP